MTADAYRWRCACCGEECVGLPMDMAFASPAGWDSLDSASRVVSSLDQDFCEIHHSSGDTYYFIRCLLLLPVPDISSEFRFGVWMSVSEKSWNAYKAGFDRGVYELSGCFGYLMHEIPEYRGSHSLQCDVHFQPDGLRPLVRLHRSDHPLHAAQRDGIDPAQVERWAALMHRPA